ncbi:MAG: hypothetical protein MHMPM18_001631 [Marteilia pararefringens]
MLKITRDCTGFKDLTTLIVTYSNQDELTKRLKSTIEEHREKIKELSAESDRLEVVRDKHLFLEEGRNIFDHDSEGTLALSYEQMNEIVICKRLERDEAQQRCNEVAFTCSDLKHSIQFLQYAVDYLNKIMDNENARINSADSSQNEINNCSNDHNINSETPSNQNKDAIKVPSCSTPHINRISSKIASDSDLFLKSLEAMIERLRRTKGANVITKVNEITEGNILDGTKFKEIWCNRFPAYKSILLSSHTIKVIRHTRILLIIFSLFYADN